jgi:predicted  nucleic acid-binding Zn-ribbon protein
MPERQMSQGTLRLIREKDEAPGSIDLHEFQRKLYLDLERNRRNDHQGSRPDLPAALDLISKVAGALELMEKRANDVETWALGSLQRFRLDLSDAEARATEFEDRARRTEELVRDLQFKLTAADQRLTKAEDRALRVEDELRKAEARALRAEDRASRAEAEMEEALVRAKRAEESIMRADERAIKAEESAKNTEAWLGHVHEVITSSLSSAVGVIDKINLDSDVTVELNKKLQGLASGRRF